MGFCNIIIKDRNMWRVDHQFRLKDVQLAESGSSPAMAPKKWKVNRNK